MIHELRSPASAKSFWPPSAPFPLPVGPAGTTELLPRPARLVRPLPSPRPSPPAPTPAPAPAPAAKGTPRLVYVDHLKGLAVLAVICAHVFSSPRLGEPLLSWAGWFTCWASQTFVLCSGYFHGRKADRVSPWAYARRRTWHLGRALVLVGAIACAARQLVAQLTGPEPSWSAFWSQFGASWWGQTTDPLGGPAFQLYFLVLLALVVTLWSVLLSVPGLRRSPAAVAAVVGGMLGLLTWRELTGAALRWPGINLETVLASAVIYGAGYLRGCAPRARLSWALQAAVAGWVAAVGLVTGNPVWIKLAVPLGLYWAFLALARVRSRPLPVLGLLGTSSATIFAYHNPLVLNGALDALGWVGLPPTSRAVTAVAVVAALCKGFDAWLRRRPARAWLRIS